MTAESDPPTQPVPNSPQTPAASPDPTPASRAARPAQGWFTRFVLAPFSSVKLGITLLIILFIYCSIGSAGIWYPISLNIFKAGVWRQQMPRQWPMFEMTEYEWFHAPFFLILCALIALNIIVTTLRRIPFKPVNYGVWMIHAGVLILMWGSIIYFGTKVEGDTPVFRRLIRITTPSGASLALPALPDRAGRVFTPAGPYTFTVAHIDPNWPIVAGDHAGERAYKVTLKIDSPEGAYTRQVVDGFPDLTEPDEAFSVSLDYFPQTQFWTRESSAIAVRRVDAEGNRGPWMEIPVPSLPRYNDRIPSTDTVWSAPATLRADPIDIPVVAHDENNPLRNKFLHVTAYLRYATLDTRVVPGGTQINPVLSLTLHTPMAGDVPQTLAAFEPQQGSMLGGMMAFKYGRDGAAMQALATNAASRVSIEIPPADAAGSPATMTIDVNASGVDNSVFREIGDSGWKVRLADVVRDLALDQRSTVSLAIIDVETPDGQRFTRWVFDEPSLSRDLPAHTTTDHAAATPTEPDPRMQATFTPGFSTPLVVIAGPQSLPLQALTLQPDGTYASRTVSIGETFPLGSAGVTINGYSERATRVQKPVVVPMEQRTNDADRSRWFSLIQIQVETPQGMQSIWLPFHQFALESASLAAPGLGRYDPTTVMLSDGTIVDLIFTRQTLPLANPVALADFRLTTHVGGYSGEVSSIRDWTSQLRFWDARSQQWSTPLSVSSNQPAEYSGFRYFQAFWDKPPRQMIGAQAEAGGLNFTGLGVGNRRGVGIQLAGTIIACIGMMYAFYVKPIIKRRRRTKVLRDLEEKTAARAAAAATTNGHAAYDRTEADGALADRRGVGAGTETTLATEETEP